MPEAHPLNRPRRRVRRALLAAVVPLALAVVVLPAAADAATVELAADGTLNYRGGSGEINSLNVRSDANGVEVKDFAGLSPRGPQCRSVTSATVHCDTFPIAVRRMDARLGDRNDSAGIRIPQLVVVDGGAGDDSLIAGTSPFVSRVDFRGGTGSSDRVSYFSATSGVEVRKDELPNDGRKGGDQDNIRVDVEEVSGSAFDDLLVGTGSDAQSSVSEVFDGNAGNDFMSGVDGPTLFRTDPVADGADRIVGSTGHDAVSYVTRTRAVTATIDHLGGDDGEPGEGDELIGSIDRVDGTPGPDTLKNFEASTNGVLLFGHDGDDTMQGGEGKDELHPGAGKDTMDARGDNDRVFANDRVGELIRCGTGIDTAELDAFDGNLSCENRRVGVLRLAPAALRTRAGDVARVALNWRHPRSWRQLRRIELRLMLRGAPIGEITIRPRSGRVAGTGAARLVGRATRLSHRGDTVTARLALRLDCSLAGRRLAIEVEAVDTRGHRQLERHAGSIRVVH